MLVMLSRKQTSQFMKAVVSVYHSIICTGLKNPTLMLLSIGMQVYFILNA